MEKKSIRDIFAQEVGDALKPKIGTQGQTPEPAPPALNDNKALRAAILDGIKNQPAKNQAATAKQQKEALREQILSAFEINPIQNGN